MFHQTIVLLLFYVYSSLISMYTLEEADSRRKANSGEQNACLAVHIIDVTKTCCPLCLSSSPSSLLLFWEKWRAVGAAPLCWIFC